MSIKKSILDWASSNKDREGSVPKHVRFSVDPKISQERYVQLKKAFDEIDTDHSGFLSFEEIHTFLKSINSEVNNEYVKQIFNLMDQNGDGKVEAEEFIQSYLKQVNALADQVAKLKQSLGDKQREQDALNAQWQDACDSEKINSWGIMEGSTLTVRVVEAQNLSGLTGKPSAFVNLVFERQQIATIALEKDRDPVWNENFTFKVAVGNGDLLIQVFNVGTVSKDDLLGSCSIPVQEFNDQSVHERWFHLTGRAAAARVLLEIQWIHHLTKYLARQIEDLKEQIEREQAEMDRATAELRDLGTNPLGMFAQDG